MDSVYFKTPSSIFCKIIFQLFQIQAEMIVSGEGKFTIWVQAAHRALVVVVVAEVAAVAGVEEAVEDAAKGNTYEKHSIPGRRTGF
jgi:hypothetical protein